MSKNYAIMFVIRELNVNGESVDDDESMYVRINQVVSRDDLYDTFDRYRDAVCVTFGAQGEQVIELVDRGQNKTSLIKAIRDIVGPGMSLKDAKDLAEAPLGTAIFMCQANRHAHALERLAEAGVKARLRNIRSSDGDVRHAKHE